MKYIRCILRKTRAPTSGEAGYFVISSGPKHVRLFHPVTCTSLEITAGEYRAINPRVIKDYDRKRLGGTVLAGWQNTRAYGRAHSQNDVHAVLDFLGIPRTAILGIDWFTDDNLVASVGRASGAEADRAHREAKKARAATAYVEGRPVTPTATPKPAAARPRAAAVQDAYAKMTSEELKAEAKKRGLRVELIAPNPGVLVMRLRNALRADDKKKGK